MNLHVGTTHGPKVFLILEGKLPWGPTKADFSSRSPKQLLAGPEAPYPTSQVLYAKTLWSSVSDTPTVHAKPEVAGALMASDSATWRFMVLLNQVSLYQEPT